MKNNKIVNNVVKNVCDKVMVSMRARTLIDKMIAEHISGNGIEPNLITMHYNNVLFMNMPDDYKDLKYRGIKIVKSYDIEEDVILVSRIKTN